VILVNARHLKAVPGRKTDVKDAEWIAQLLAHGLLQPSFVPDREIRELRDLTRHRTKLTQQRAAAINRIQKVLEDANIKLASVATDVMGVSGRAMLEQLAAGNTDGQQLAELSRGTLRKKLPQLREALEGRFTEHHRFLLRELLDQIDYLGAAIERVSIRIEGRLRPFLPEIARMDTIPGLNRRLCETLVAEIGPDMSWFPSDQHLVSWACVCPGNNETAGKHKPGHTRTGNNWLRGALVEAAWAASKTKDTYLASFYRRIMRRRGKKRAVVALARLFAAGIAQAEVARRLEVTPTSVHRWYHAWKEQGEAGLGRRGPPGPQPRLSLEQLRQLEQALLAGPAAAGYATELWTLGRINTLKANVSHPNRIHF
jgi:transposase